MAEHQGHTIPRSIQIKQELTQPTIRVVLALVILGVIQFLIVQVPGTDQVVIDPDITIATLLFSAITLMMYGAIINYASSSGAVLANIFEEIPELERIVQLVSVLVVLVWAYQVFWWLPYFRENPTHYDYVFLILGIVFVGWLGYILYSNIDEVSAVLTGQVVEGIEPPTESTEVETGSVETEMGSVEADTTPSGAVGNSVTCPQCRDSMPVDADFCSSCGADLTESKA